MAAPTHFEIQWRNVGVIQRHTSGTPWTAAVWALFRDWAHENGALDVMGDLEWLKGLKHHRKNGPAIVGRDGLEVWKLNGILHRVDGPAIIHTDVCQSWWLNGLRHRKDGPANILSDGTQEWWLKGIQYTDETFSTPVTQ